MTTAFLLMEVFSLSLVCFEATDKPASLLWLWPSCFISRLFFLLLHLILEYISIPTMQPVAYINCFVRPKIPPNAAGKL